MSESHIAIFFIQLAKSSNFIGLSRSKPASGVSLDKSPQLSNACILRTFSKFLTAIDGSSIDESSIDESSIDRSSI